MCGYNCLGYVDETTLRHDLTKFVEGLVEEELLIGCDN